MTPLAAYLLLFLAVGVGFIFVHLLAGKLIRPSKPDPEKGSVYECGEPTIGSAWVQFDLRFYVVALLFVIFDVEVAFFFPWAEVFGKANAVATAQKPETAEEYSDYAVKVLDLASPVTSTGSQKDALIPYQKARTREGAAEQLAEQEALREKAKTGEVLTTQQSVKMSRDGPLSPGDFERNRDEARKLSRLALVEVLVFFGVLLVGFAYLWRRGDLQWVRSTAAERLEPLPPPILPTTIAASAAPPEPVSAAGPH